MEIFKLFGSIFLKGADESEKKIKGLSGVAGKLGGAFSEVGKVAAIAGGAVAVAGGAASMFAIKSAMDLEAMGSKFNTVFDGFQDQANGFIEKFQELTPATRAEAQAMASGMQDLLIPMGFAREEATNMTGELMHVSGALANFNSGTHTAEQVTAAMQSALLGQYKPLAALGVQLDVNKVKQLAVAQGLAKTTKEVTKQQMAQVAVKEIYAQSGDALTAYTEENLDATTKIKILKANVTDLAADLGMHLIPVINDMLSVGKNLLKWLKEFSQSEEFQKKINDIKQVAKDVISNLKELGAEVLEKLGPALEFLKNLFTDIGYIISGDMTVFDTLTDIYGANADKLQGLIDGFNSFIDLMKGIFAPIIDDIVKHFINLKYELGPIQEKIGQLQKTFVDNVLPALQTVGQVIGVILIAAFGILGGAIDAILQALGPFIQTLLSLVDVLMNVLAFWVEVIKAFFTGDWSKVKKIFFDLVESIKSVFINLFKTVVILLGTFVINIIKFFSNMVDQLVGGSGVIPKMARDMVMWYKKWVTDIILIVVNFIGSFISKIINFVAKVVGAFVGLRAKMVNAVKDAFIGIVSTILSFQVSIFKKAVSIGVAIYKGIADGITGGIDFVKEKITGLATGAIDAGKKVLGVKSPSKVFAEIGGNVVEGFNQGLDEKDVNIDGKMIKSTNVLADMPTIKSNQKQITIGPEAFAGAMLMDDYGVDRLIDKISQRFKEMNL
jgi:phage-related protein